MHAHIDADSLIYQIAYYNQSEEMDSLEDQSNDSTDSLTLAKDDCSWAVPIIADRINSLLEVIKCTEYTLHLTASSKNYSVFTDVYGIRPIPQFTWEVSKDLDHGYKHNRVQEPPETYLTIVRAMMNNFNCVMHDEWEADHAVVAYKIKDPKNVMVIALDKDVLNQAPGVHWNYGKNEPHITSDRYATFYKYWQTIIGDPSDGYKGVPGIGPAKATKLINEQMSEYELWQAVVKAYKSKQLTEKEALATIRLADMTQVTVDPTGALQLCLFSPPLKEV